MYSMLYAPLFWQTTGLHNHSSVVSGGRKDQIRHAIELDEFPFD